MTLRVSIAANSEQGGADIMTTTSAGISDWANERGDRWRDHLDDLEAELEPLNAPLIEALDLSEPLEIADLGCGGGGASRGIFDAAVEGSTVTGFDISPALIEAATARNHDAGPGLHFQVADLQKADAPGSGFDRLMSRFGVMFFPDPEAAFRNLARWLKPDGKFAFAVWGPPQENLWLYQLKRVVADYVDVPAAEPNAPGPFRYADPTPFTALLDEVGFSDITVTNWRSSIPVGGELRAKDAARFAVSAFSIGSLLHQLDTLTKEAAIEKLSSFFAEYEVDGVVRMPAAAHIIAGRGTGC